VAPDVALAVRQWPGDAAPPFLLVHGLASNARMWDGVASRLADAGHAAAAVDQRGHGQSDKPDTGYDFETLTDDLVSVMDALGFDRAIVAGQSWGGNVAIELALRHPERLRGIACIDGGTIELARSFPEWDDAAVALAPPELAGTPIAQIETYMRQAHADWPEEGIAGALANFDVSPDGIAAPFLTRERHMTILRGLWAHRPSTLYGDIKVPVLIVAASELTPLRDASTRIARVRAVRVPAHHDIHAQHPDVIAGLLLDALADGFYS
jgi:pimeloyl-ACP methyl ester carboxylesterase